jgi:hypothetical protein
MSETDKCVQVLKMAAVDFGGAFGVNKSSTCWVVTAPRPAFAISTRPPINRRGRINPPDRPPNQISIKNCQAPPTVS